MFNIFKNLLDFNAKEINKLRKRVDEINALEDKTRDLKDADFQKETEKLKKQIKDGSKTLDQILPWTYALVREASRRVHGERHFDVQLMAGVALHEKKVVEQKTGEGKTLTATTALYLNALAGKGVHLVTVNDYLVRRDAGWMGDVFHFLGLTTSAIISDQSFIYDHKYIDQDAQDWRLRHLRSISRKEAYETDITYGINSEFGFDYLRDNMKTNPNEIVQRGYYFAIIDEADSVLIDEARTPHIISAPYEQDTSKYYQYAKIVKQLHSGTDYVIDEKLRTANLTEAGVQAIEKNLGVNNVYEQDYETLFHIEAALKAETLFKKDKDYIVRGGEVIIVDEFTGRLLQGRRFSEGLHQAIEAKENVAIQNESKTLATVSLQNYFRMYEKLGGMTGTAATEAEEFHKIYKTDVLVIPTHRTMVRKDMPDRIYKTERAKYNAVVDEIERQATTGRPVLVGTTSIEKNELLSSLLTKRKVKHQLLNAKNHESEAQIIADAGKKGAITIATNMAGRGVDIILGGNAPTPEEEKNMTKEELKKRSQELKKNHEEVVELGGLCVMGTERHESRRIDNQLRGRSGRQGDPGETVFFVSLEDDLMRIFGGDQIAKIMSFLNFPEDQPLSHPMVSKALEQSQVKVEGFNFDIRKHLVEFDDVLNKQREIVYELRRKMLFWPEKDPDGFKNTVLDIFREEITSIVSGYIAMKDSFTEEELNTVGQDLLMIVPDERDNIVRFFKEKDFIGLQEHLLDVVQKQFELKEKQLGQVIWFDIVKNIFLSTIDQYWTEHLTAIEDLREGINLRGYAQLDPLVEYKNEAYKMFEKLMNNIDGDVTRRIFRIEVNITQPPFEEGEIIEENPRQLKKRAMDPRVREDDRKKKKEEKLILKSASNINPFSQKAATQEPQETMAPVNQEAFPSQNQADQNGGFKVIPPGSVSQKLGRNDPCWCGSGKKYKKCHWPN